MLGKRSSVSITDEVTRFPIAHSKEEARAYSKRWVLLGRRRTAMIPDEEMVFGPDTKWIYYYNSPLIKPLVEKYKWQVICLDPEPDATIMYNRLDSPYRTVVAYEYELRQDAGSQARPTV